MGLMVSWRSELESVVLSAPWASLEDALGTERGYEVAVVVLTRRVSGGLYVALPVLP